ncbi:MAG: glycosyltransferase [Acidobacteria bacterium]|nr:glycosyltransferase [Acidobacteriota bacterium]
MPEKKIKILHVLDSLGVGGMERVVIDVVNHLDQSRFDHVVCCISRQGEAAPYLREGIRCVDLGKGAGADYLAPVKIARLIGEESPDIIHAQSWSGVDALMAKMMAGAARLVHSEHGRNYPHIHSEPLKRKVARRCLYHLSDAVFAISAEVRDYYCRETGFPRERMPVIPNGVDLRRIDGAGGGARAELGIGSEDFVIGTVARLDATKDTMTLARAFARLYRLRQGKNLKLLIVGAGDQQAVIENFIAEQGLGAAVIFTGLRHDAPRLYGAMNVFALSSLSEGMPLTVLEAMAARLPVVATNVGAAPELVEEGGTGFLVEPKDDQALAERLARLYSEPELARRFGEAARRKVEREYSLELMLRRYADLYLSVIRK